jgi:uncharacterized NAD(P)/FAD-binding protein YdhS
VVHASGIKIWLMVHNTTFKNISGISRRSVLLVRKPEFPQKNTNLSQVTDKLYHRTELQENVRENRKGNKEWTINLETESALATKH